MEREGVGDGWESTAQGILSGRGTDTRTQIQGDSLAEITQPTRQREVSSGPRVGGLTSLGAPGTGLTFSTGGEAARPLGARSRARGPED